MRSYYEHLQQTSIAPEKRPIFRSSAIFPVFREGGISCRIIFLGYWFLKRYIQDITAVVTLRSLQGEVLLRNLLSIEDPCSYRIELDDLLFSINVPVNEVFHGSLEIEFHSSKNMVFPFPAVTINYYGPAFSSVVHSAQRIYNDYEDMHVNSQTNVPESGFNIHADHNHEPLIGMINGAEEVKDGKVDFTFYNKAGEVLQQAVSLGDMEPYETRFIYPAREIDLQTFFNGDVGTAKMRFKLNWIFPRLLVGNLQKSPRALVITHSYYDCTEVAEDSSYWRETDEKWYPAGLIVPFRFTDQVSTSLYFYPIYSPSTFTIDVEVYDAEGNCQEKKERVIEVKAPLHKMIEIKLSKICQELKINPSGDLGVRLMAKTAVGDRIPARIKLAVDIGDADKNILPCNFCTNMQPFNPGLEKKSKSFRWAPILADQKGASAWIMNSSPAKEWDESADVHLTFYRESDTNTIERDVSIAPHGFLIIRPDDDPELAVFFQNKIGWFTATSNQPYTTTYYFVEHSSGVVGGDHGF